MLCGAGEPWLSYACDQILRWPRRDTCRAQGDIHRGPGYDVSTCRRESPIEKGEVRGSSMRGAHLRVLLGGVQASVHLFTQPTPTSACSVPARCRGQRNSRH